ncbi:MAG: SGNH/GDSL hydrolase family protein [Burkholderiaceae bacterium]
MKWTVNGWRRAMCGAAVLAVTLLAACGGGEQVRKFTPSRVIAFGDESSLIDGSGAKYSVNAVVAGSTVLDCAANPLWVQTVATGYGLVFPQCNPLALPAPASRIHAASGAHVADLAAQIDQQVASGGFTSSDLVTILIGSNDVIDQFLQYPGLSEAQLTTRLEQAAADLATQINRVADLGAKVLISTVPDLGLTPFAGPPGGANALLLSRLTDKFNIEMRTRIYNDGRRIGLVQIDSYLRLVRNQSGAGVFVNMTDAVCATSAALPNCSTLTLRTTNDANNQVPNATWWLWADDRHLSAGGQARFGELALLRAQNNPF